MTQGPDLFEFLKEDLSQEPFFDAKTFPIDGEPVQASAAEGARVLSLMLEVYASVKARLQAKQILDVSIQGQFLAAAILGPLDEYDATVKNLPLILSGAGVFYGNQGDHGCALGDDTVLRGTVTNSTYGSYVNSEAMPKIFAGAKPTLKNGMLLEGPLVGIEDVVQCAKTGYGQVYGRYTHLYIPIESRAVEFHAVLQ